MRFSCLLVSVCAASILAGCAAKPAVTYGEAPFTAPAAGEDVVIPPVAVADATPVPPPSRVRVAPPRLPPGDEIDRVTVTATRTDMRRGSLTDYLRILSNASCEPGSRVEAGRNVAITARPVPLQAINPSRKKIGEITFVAGFHLTSPDPAFGGLSGLDMLDNGSLLAVSDAGSFVWIDLAADGVTPTGARIAPMRDAGGEPLTGADNADAEGLAVNGGMALVSFERDHRILAFDLGKCGAAARGAPIAFGPYGQPLPDAMEEPGLPADANAGVEALGLTGDWYMVSGAERKVEDLSPLSIRPVEAEPLFALRVGVEEPELVGLDIVAAGGNKRDVRVFMAHRSYSPQADNAIVITETDFKRYNDGLPLRVGGELDERSHQRFVETGWRNLAELNFLLTIDNFEGIAAKEMPDGRVRLFIVSDDDFSASHRTLLMVFDVPRPTR